MAKYEELKYAVAQVIKNNGNEEITGDVLQNTLLAIINSVGEHSGFAGIAKPTDDPGMPDQNVFYIATEPGTYVNFNFAVVEDEALILEWRGEWIAHRAGFASMTAINAAIQGKLDKAEFYRYFEEVNIGTEAEPVYATRSKRGLFSDSFLSSLGLNSSGGGGTGGASYDRLDLWSDYTSERAGWVLSAGLGYDLYSRVRSLEGGSALSFTDEGTGNVVTAVKKSGTAVVVTKGLTALTSHQPIYALNFQAGAFEAKKYTPNTGAQTVNIPTFMSHIYDDIGYMYHYRQAGVNANDLLRISIAEISGGSNMPTSATWHQVMAWGTSDNGYAVQLATPYDVDGSLYLRHKTISAWRSWREILDSVNYKSYTISKNDRLDLWSDYTSERAGWVLSAGLGYELHNRVSSLEGGMTAINAAIQGKLDKAEFYKYFEEVNIGTAEAPVYVTRSKRSLFTDGFLSALGLNPNTGGGGGGGATALSELSDVQLSGLLTGDVLIYDGTHWVNRPQSSIVPALSEYATRVWVQQQGYATSAALTAHAGDTSLHVTSSERTLWNRTAADFAAIVGADSDQIINKWEEVVAFLDTYTEADTLAKLLSNKVDKVTGYGLSKNDFTDALLSKLNGIEAGANRYIHPTGGADAAIDDAAGRVLAGITVNVLGHVTSVSSKTLAAADIPTLSISKVSGLQDALDGKLDAATFDDLFEKVNIGTTSAPKYAIRAKYGLYADGFLSSLGLNSSGGGGTGGASYDRLDLWSDYTSERAGWVLSAGLGYDLYSRVRSLEGGSALSFTDEGTGNVVTAVKKSGTAVVVTKGLTALTSHQPIYALNFQAGAFEAKKYTPNTGAQTVNIPTFMSHIYDDIGYMYHYRQAGVNANDLLRISIAEISGGSNMPTSATWHQVMAWGTSDNGYAVQLATPYDVDGSLYLRHKTISAWRSWRELIDSANYKSYTVSKTGEGASGTWAIGISGTAAKATSAETSNTTRQLEAFADDTFTNGQHYIKAIRDASGWTTRLWMCYKDGAKQGNAVWVYGADVAQKLQDAHTIWGQTFDGTGPVFGDMKDVGDISMAGQISSTNIHPFRMVYGNYGAFFRQDGDSLYLMLTNANDQYGSYNNLRPLQVSLGLGDVSLCSTMYVKHSGSNVGIGISTPSYKLDVAGDIHSSEYIRADKAVLAPFLRVNTSTGAFIGDAVEGLGEGYTGLLLYSYGYTPIHLATNGYVRAIITAGGNFGIGNLAPTYPLDVTGVIHSTAGIFSDSYMSAKGINTASDVRLKRRIADVALTVKDVAEAPVYRFAWINGGGIDVGSTAQYWGAIVPELTHKLPDGKYYGLDYGKTALLSAIAVARTVQSHEERIAELERENEQLKQTLKKYM